MEKRAKGCIFAAIALYGCFATALVLAKLAVPEDLDSPASITRDVPGYRSGRLGILKKASRDDEFLWPASEPMAQPVEHVLDDKSQLWVWPGEPKPGSGTAPDRWRDALEGDDEIELVAVATWYPKATDPVGEESPTDFPLVFHEATSLQPIDSAELKAQSVPPEMFRISAPKEYFTPRIRFLFRIKNMPYVRIRDIHIADSNTSAVIGYDVQALDEEETRFQVSGEWCIVDSVLLAWHDTPLSIRMELLTGEAEIASLARETGKQIQLGDSLRLQWITTVAPETEVDSVYDLEWVREYPESPSEATTEHVVQEYDSKGIGIHAAFHFVPEEDEDEPARGVVRTSSEDLLREHVALRDESGIHWDWTYENEENPVALFSSPLAAGVGGEIELVFIPYLAELEFSLPGIPAPPNAASPEDLFEITLPRLTLPEDPSDAEQQLIGVLSSAAQVSWDRKGRWGTKPPRHFPRDRTFRNETPQSLLNWYLKNTSGSFIRYNPEQLTLRVNERDETWWDRLIEKFNGLPFMP